MLQQKVSAADHNTCDDNNDNVVIYTAIKINNDNDNVSNNDYCELSIMMNLIYLNLEQGGGGGGGVCEMFLSYFSSSMMS